MTAFDTLENVGWKLHEDGLAVVTITRPKALNALNDRTFDELRSVFEFVRDDASVKAVVVTGSGEKSFVAGADIVELADLDEPGGAAVSAKGQDVFTLIETCGKAVIAAVNGFALGGGLELALACHVRFASEKARLGLPEVTLGLIPGYGGTQRLARLVGLGRAVEMLISGDMIDAAAADRIGLVNRVLPPDELMGAAEAFARRVMKRGPVAVRLALEATLQGTTQQIEEGLLHERVLFGRCFATDDMREGTRAFLEKRKADFKGA